MLLTTTLNDFCRLPLRRTTSTLKDVLLTTTLNDVLLTAVQQVLLLVDMQEG
jgi:hypothetical protein